MVCIIALMHMCGYVSMRVHAHTYICLRMHICVYARVSYLSVTQCKHLIRKEMHAYMPI